MGNNDKRIISTDIIPEEDRIENGLRPASLSEYIGQEKAKKEFTSFYRSCEET